MRFKVGDKVKVKDNLKINTSYGNLCYVRSMEKYANGIFEIKSINKDFGSYTLSIPAPYDTWTDEMLDPIVEDSAKTQKREIILSTFKKMKDEELAYAYASVVKCSECPFQMKCQEHETVECLKRIKSWLGISPETKQTWKA